MLLPFLSSLFHLKLAVADDIDIELRLARFEHLMDRRPLLLNSVLLRQNPHNVHEWLKRVELYKGKRQFLNFARSVYSTKADSQ